jgi:hypothetical protein
MQDFFATIEGEQTTAFNLQTNSPSPNFFQQQATFNPFSQGGAFGASPFQQPFSVPPQQTGFVMPQQTGFHVQSAHNPFGHHLQPHLTAMPFIQPQPTAAPMMPQITGINPFRQNSLNGVNGMQPQPTGFSPSQLDLSLTNPPPFGTSQPGRVGSSSLESVDTPTTSVSESGMVSASPLSSCVEF